MNDIITTPRIVVDSDKDWSFTDIENIYTEIEKIGIDEMHLDIYPNQIEVISSEQMLDAYSSHGLPTMYNHWSFGKEFIKNRKRYLRGMMGLAYEIVINSNPCIQYIMEENSLLMQTLVIAHAGFGHNTFFKTNYLFKQWTDAGNIIDYVIFAKNFINKCEEKYGITNVERVIDAAHSISQNSFFKYPRKEKLSIRQEMDRKIDRALEEERSYNDLWKTLPNSEKPKISKKTMNYEFRKEKFSLPEENLLYFIETYSPHLKNWEREILRIIRNINQYFYPNLQTKIGNEGAATWAHFNILNRLYDKKIITDGAMLEFLTSHTSVIMQPTFHQKYYGGLNPYALGFAIMQDITRICHEPTQEDKEWFPDFAGCKDHLSILKNVWANYRDESMIRQFLSPKVIRDFKFFSVETTQDLDYYKIKNIHNQQGYKHIRHDLASLCDISALIPEIEVSDFDVYGDRKLSLTYNIKDDKTLEKESMTLTLRNIADLWGYDVLINYMQKNGGDDANKVTAYVVSPSKNNIIGGHSELEF